MKKMSLALLVSLSFAASAMASDYTYGEESYKIAFEKGAVKTTQCRQKKCESAEAEVKTLMASLEKHIADYAKMLETPDKLIAEAKKQTVMPEPDRVVKDPTNEKQYVMVKFGKNFNLPLDMEAVSKGDFSLVVGAMQANHDRYQLALDMLKNGKAPSAFKTDDYSKIAPVASLHNIVSFAKYLQ